MAANPNPSRITDAMWWLWESLQRMEPTSVLGGIYANKPGYHGTRGQNDPSNYSVTDDPPDQGGPGDKAGALDWTFPEAQSGDYSRISQYTSRLMRSAQDPDDPRLNGWREFYGNADTDSYVEGWDTRYGYPATSDSSHLWHCHLSEDRDKTTSYTNKDAMLSVLMGESVEEWSGDVPAEDVWAYDIDPSSNKYSAGGATWTVYQRTDYLANDFAPMVTRHIESTTQELKDQGNDLYELTERFHQMLIWYIVTALALIVLGLVTLATALFS